jgi:hypothetical protein
MHYTVSEIYFKCLKYILSVFILSCKIDQALSECHAGSWLRIRISTTLNFAKMHLKC